LGTDLFSPCNIIIINIIIIITNAKITVMLSCEATGALYNSYRVTVSLNNKQYDGSGERPQTSDSQIIPFKMRQERSVFSSQQKVSRDSALWTDAGSSFHALAVATGNAG